MTLARNGPKGKGHNVSEISILRLVHSVAAGGVVVSLRAASALAWSLFALYVALWAWTGWQVWHGPATAEASLGVITIGYAAVGALVAARRPGNVVGWLLVAIALVFAIEGVAETYVLTPSHPGYVTVAWFATWAWSLLLAGIFLPLVFPDGQLLSRRWRPVVWLGAAALTVNVVGAAFKPGELDPGAPVRTQNPLGAPGALGDVIGFLAHPLGDTLLAVTAVLAAASLVLRFWGAQGTERQQLKWFALAGVVILGGAVLAMSYVFFPDGWRAPLGAVGWFTLVVTFTIGVPAATGIAILRHRLYDIDVVINRALVYGALTAMLAATYVGGVLVLQFALRAVTNGSGLAVAVSTLATAAVFRPARSRIQAAVDRRFFRRKYDAARTLEAFSARLRHQVDLDTLTTELRAVVADTMQPAHVSLWTRERVQ